MKTLISVFFLILAFGCCPKKNVGSNELIVSQQLSKQKGIQFILKSITNDSRCPKGVNCIWSGEVTTIVSVYNNDVLIEEESLVFSPRNEQKMKDYFSKHSTNRQIKKVEILPYPKEGVKVNEGDYFIKVTFLE